jgi:two-component system response regulator AlgR
VRIHRNCLVARSAIAGFEKGGEEGESGWLMIVNGLQERLPISRRQMGIVKEYRK